MAHSPNVARSMCVWNPLAQLSHSAIPPQQKPKLGPEASRVQHQSTSAPINVSTNQRQRQSTSAPINVSTHSDSVKFASHKIRLSPQFQPRSRTLVHRAPHARAPCSPCLSTVHAVLVHRAPHACHTTRRTQTTGGTCGAPPGRSVAHVEQLERPSCKRS
jgi:hypothetical protein